MDEPSLIASHKNTAFAYKVLLVEDNPGDVRLVEKALELSNLSVQLHHSSNGEDAIHYLLGKKGSPEKDLVQAIILDVNLPKENGFEVLRVIKNDPALRDIPVLVFTSSEAEADVKTAFELHADSYILKGSRLQDFRLSLINSLRYWLHLEPPDFNGLVWKTSPNGAP